MRNYMLWQKKTNYTGKVIIGTIAGIAAGLTAGLLTAPRPGRETRQIISGRTSETLSEMKKNLAQTREKVLHKAEEATSDI
ncbi:MAG: YtxH domain-containing protein [Desulfobulbaceae bacterium]|nr:YtxH domain-containing protein [Desulfobulbaceae bacterium]